MPIPVIDPREFVDILGPVTRPGDFYASGSVVTPIPRLIVEGVGLVSFPLPSAQAEALVAVAERAPYGRGTETLVDTDVRRTWQIAPSRLRIDEPHWNRTIQKIVARSADALGVDGPVSAELYKLLIYDQGSFFVEHRDTEKTDGMFGTLVVVLPSVYGGGELIVRHGQREICLDLAGGSVSEATYAAFYADCRHELRPVVEGCRLALIYNLVRPTDAPSPRAPDYGPHSERAAATLRAWAANASAPDAPIKLVYPLEHHYTSAGLSFAGLKGPDAARASALTRAARAAGCAVHLAMISIKEFGSAEHAYYGYRSRRRRYDEDLDDEFVVDEVFERSQVVDEWHAPDGDRLRLGPIPFEGAELCPPDALEDEKPDELHFHEATGNEGASFDRVYRRAALVLWPQDRVLAVVAQAGLAATVPHLCDLADRFTATGGDRSSEVWREAHALAGQMIAQWPSRAAADDVTATLEALVALDAVERIEAFMTDVAAAEPADSNHRLQATAIADACAALDEASAATAVERIAIRHALLKPKECAALLARLGPLGPGPDGADRLWPAVDALIDRMPPDPRVRAHLRTWEPGPTVDRDFVVHLMTITQRIDHPTLAERAVTHVIAHHETYDLDAAVVPALLAIGPASAGSPGLEALTRIALDHLDARIAEPLTPPSDWARSAVLECPCGDCGQLRAFLVDPKRSKWVFKISKPRRRHLDNQLAQHRCDADAVTVPTGSPYGWVCTKNQRSYERRCAERERDLAARAQLGGASPAVDLM